MADDMDQIIIILLCIFIPPFAVYYKSRECDMYVLIALILMIFFWIPGIIFALWFCMFRN